VWRPGTASRTIGERGLKKVGEDFVPKHHTKKKTKWMGRARCEGAEGNTYSTKDSSCDRKLEPEVARKLLKERERERGVAN